MDGQPPKIPLRSPSEVMRLGRMGSYHPTRLSFMRQMLRRMAAEAWQVDRPLWDVDTHGVGRALYRARGPERTYTLVAFAHDLPDHLRSDRVIAEAWDATFTLFDGEPTQADLQRLEGQVPGQETARMSGRELTLSRANRSVRLFSHVVDRLANGEQPDTRMLSDVGYLMRTTAVYGSGKFGLSDREAIADRPEFASPFQAEMLTVWLIRAFTVDIAEHLARVRNPDAATLSPDLRRNLGVGNSTGLGMAPFLLTHPVLINNWIEAKETALARVRERPITEDDLAHLRRLVGRAIRNAEEWRSDHPLQVEKIQNMQHDLAAFDEWLRVVTADHFAVWDEVWIWVESSLGPEGQEQVLALLLEPFGEIIDDLCASMSADETAAFDIDGMRTVGSIRAQIECDYRWALDTDWNALTAKARLWYTSTEKLEPRLAERAEEPLEPYEQPLAPGREIAALYSDLCDAPSDQPIAVTLQAVPEHRYAVRRLQQMINHPFGEIQDNTIAHDMLPIDLLRAKLSFFGATRFDPRSDRWVRITMFQGAPFPNEPELWGLDDWMLPH
ncbi:MAG: hypothetical protein AAF557_00830 [Pseudomonadota bacterium]